MPIQTVPAATWGIPEPTFFFLYLLALLAALGLGFAFRAIVVHAIGFLGSDRPRLSRIETAMLFSDKRAVRAALRHLRRRGLIDASGTPVPADHTTADSLDPLSRAVLSSLRESGIKAKKKHLNTLVEAVQAPLVALRTTLVDRHYLLSPRHQKTLWLASLPMFALVMLGAVRIISSTSSEPLWTGLLALAVISAFFCSVRLSKPIRLSALGQNTIEKLRWKKIRAQQRRNWSRSSRSRRSTHSPIDDA